MTGIGIGRSASRRGRSLAMILVLMQASLRLLDLLRQSPPSRCMCHVGRLALCLMFGIRPLAYLAGSLLCFGPCCSSAWWRFFSITSRAARLSLRNRKGPEWPCLVVSCSLFQHRHQCFAGAVQLFRFVSTSEANDVCKCIVCGHFLAVLDA